MLLNKNPGMDPLSRECTEPGPSNADIYVFQSSSPDLHDEARLIQIMAVLFLFMKPFYF